MCLALPFLFAACSSDEPGGGGGGSNDSSKVLGKSFKTYDVTEYSHSVQETTTYVEFPHSRVCRVRDYVTESGYNNDSYSFTNYYEYVVKGNEIIVTDVEWEEEQYRFKLSGGNLKRGNTVYVANGSVELDYSLDEKLPPEGERTYFDVGWYVAKSIEQDYSALASDYVRMGDIQGLRDLPELYYYEEPMGKHVVDKHTLEPAYIGISTNRPSNYYATQTYRVGSQSVTFYFYFASKEDSYPYRIVDGIVYLRTKDGSWKKGMLMDSEKIGYNGGYEYE